MAEQYSSFPRGGLLWVLQRVTAAFLIVVLAFHLFMVHFINHAAEITFAGTHFRMQQWGYYTTMVLFLITATFHGVNGVYALVVPFNCEDEFILGQEVLLVRLGERIPGNRRVFCDSEFDNFSAAA